MHGPASATARGAARSIATFPENAVPLVVDLDGTLTPADMTVESLLRAARRHALAIFVLIGWLLRGRRFAKALAVRRAPPDVSAMPLNGGVVALVEAARAAGRPTILATASHQRIADRVARWTGLFDLAIGSTRRRHVKSAGKLAVLRAVLGTRPFDYVGDSPADTPIWHAARTAYSCRHRPAGIATRMIDDVERRSARAILRALRPHQWAKNALVLVPVVAAGQVFAATSLGSAITSAMLFSLVASGVYLINDLLDIDADRAHPVKRRRPIAAGSLPAVHALLLALALVGTALAGSVTLLGGSFAAVLLGYLLLTTLYSLRLKAVLALDVITLGCLYTLRIIAGAVAADIAVSTWLLLFSVFFFLSLGYLKRFTELGGAADPARLLHGRGYIGSDRPVVAMAGTASGMVSILVMAQFITDEKATGVYASPLLLWGVLLCLLYWITRVWVMAYRNEVDGDPVAFAVRDRRSLAVALVAAATLLVARSIAIPGLAP